MKFRIDVPEEEYEGVRDYLKERGVELSEDADYVVTGASRYPTFLTVKSREGERALAGAGGSVGPFIEAFGKEIEVHTAEGTFLAGERMYQLEEGLNPKEFLRVSKSVIIARGHVKKIRPTLSMKYILTMTNGTLVDVTRSYYSDFRRFFGF